MRSPFKTFGLHVTLLLAVTALSNAANAQIPLKEFVLFGNTGVTVGSSTEVINGKVGSNVLVQSTGKSTFGGDVHSLGQIRLANSNAVKGMVSAANATVPSVNPAFQTGSNVYLGSTVNVKGNVVIGGGRVEGPVVYSGTYSGPQPAKGRSQGTPSLPSLPSLPFVFSPAYSGGTNISGTKAIDPGSWGDVTLRGGQTVTFNKPGVYIFKSIKNSGNINSFVFNFPNTDGRFRIYVINDVDLYKINVRYTGAVPGFTALTNSDLAARIFLQIKGNGSTCSNRTDAFSMAGGASGSGKSTWLGTVWAPNGNIRIGSGSSSAKTIGALWSGKKVILESGVSIQHSAFLDCSPKVDAGPDKSIDCDNPTAVLTASVSGTDPQYRWKRLGTNSETYSGTASIRVSKAGTYVLLAASMECTSVTTDTVVLTSTPCVLPYYPPPATGKVSTKIGSELTSLSENFGNVTDDGKTLFILKDGYVLIDIIVKQGNYDAVKTTLLTAAYGLKDTISNGRGSLIITGFYPVANLSKLSANPLASLISFVRPSYPPISNSGLIQTQGDSAIRTNFVRNGFHLSGENVKVGVLSDSYNTIPNNDVANGDLPGLNGEESVDVVLDYPYGQRSDEGRAMLQIVHDVAPKAKLAFRTGFITAGDMAQGIGELTGKGCKVIADDVTFITEPFFKPGVIANAIHQASLQGVNYVTAAGNFGVKSYEGNFHPSTATLPDGIQGVAHDFSLGTVPGGDIFQSDSVKGTITQPGLYTIVLQWDNDVYSLGGNPGAALDLDAYAYDNLGNMIGFNRINIDGDPTEVLTFYVTRNTVVNIMIVRASPGSTPIHFKYVGFRGDLKINEYNLGSSTIVGQANAPDALTVGAAFYGNTPAFGVANITHSSFSSPGGTQYLGAAAQKPDVVGPSGTNTSVEFGSIDFENDGRPNFFGTSAAVPHIAGTVALLVQARQQFFADVLTPAQIKSVLKSSAVDMEAPGFDLNTGAGFVQADSALRTMANPTPQINGVTLVDPSVVLGSQPTQITVSGSYLTSNTKVVLGTDTLPSAITNSETVTATVPAFDGSRNLYLYNDPKSKLLNDGGLSDPFALNGIMKKVVTVKADDKVRKYGEKTPDFTLTILVDGEPTNLTLAELGLANVTTTTQALPLSNVGLYFIRPTKVFDSTGVDAPFLKKYNYLFTDGVLAVQKMPLTITAANQTIVYGTAPNITFNYQFNEANIADKTQFLNTIKLIHQSGVPFNALAVIKDFGALQANGTTLSASDLAGMSMMASFQALNNARRFDVSQGRLVPATSSAFNLYYLIDVASQSLYNYKTTPNSSPFVQAYPTISGKAIVGADALAQGIAKVSANGSLVQLVNGSLVQMVNSGTASLAPILDGHLVQLVNGQLVQLTDGVFVQFNDATLVSINFTKLQQLVNGEVVQLSNGSVVQLVNGQLQQIVNGSLVQLVNGLKTQLSNGTLVQLVNAQLQQLVNGSLVQLVSGQLVQLVSGSLVQLVSGSLVQLVNGKLVQLVNGEWVPLANGQLVQLVSGSLVQMVNGQLQQLVNGSLAQLVNGSLVQLVSGQLVQIVNGSPQPIPNGSLVQLVNGQLVQMVNNALAPLPSGSLVQLVNGTLAQLVNSSQLANGTLVQLVNGSLVQLVNGILVQLVNSANSPGINSKTAVIVDATDVSQQNGWLGAMLGVNMITGLEYGEQKVVSGVFVNGNFDVTYGVGTVMVQPNPCLITHSKFTNFGSTTSAPTSMWLNVKVKISGQLKKPGDYLSFTGGKIDFNNITSTPAVTNYAVPNGKIVADASVTTPVTKFDLANFTWVTKVPPGFCSTSDIFISGAIINSSNGFTRKTNAYTSLKGIFYSNRHYCDQWSYALAAYQPQFDYTKLAPAGSVAAKNGIFRAGTPIPLIRYLVSGGSSGGRGNCTGSSSAMDRFEACVSTNTTTFRTSNTSASDFAELMPVSEENNLTVNTLDAYPNPASQKLSVTYGVKSRGSVTLAIMDLYGRTVLVEQNIEAETGKTYERKLDISRLASGVYFVKMITGGEIIMKKIIIANQ